MGANINYEYAKQWEGAVKDPITGKKDPSLGYWPSTSSGLTIGHGFDLSNFSEAELKKAGVSAKDIKQVHNKDVSYLKSKGSGVKWDWMYGPKGSQLATYGNKFDILKRDESGKSTGYKIKWSSESVNNMQDYLEKRFTRSAKATYERLTKDDKDFEKLTPVQQTVLYSITSNAGESFIEDSTINLKNAVINDDWEAIEGELLRGKWKSNLTRRRDEGLQLQEDRKAREQKQIDQFFPDEAVVDSVTRA